MPFDMEMEDYMEDEKLKTQIHNVIIAIDDLHPEKGWGCDGDLSVAYLKNLWEEFGCKFTLFVPSNYHGKYPLSEHKDWVDFWKEKEWVELAAHGHYHKCERTDIGECEFFELNYLDAVQRIGESMGEWQKCGIRPSGFRMPGWACNQESAQAISNIYSYVAAHEDINKHIDFGGMNVFYGCDGIHQTDSIKSYNNTFMFQSHIAGDWNDNVWNEENYENFRNVLEYLRKSYILKYKTIGELI